MRNSINSAWEACEACTALSSTRLGAVSLELAGAGANVIAKSAAMAAITELRLNVSMENLLENIGWIDVEAFLTNASTLLPHQGHYSTRIAFPPIVSPDRLNHRG
jgi:hypothetical protein